MPRFSAARLALILTALAVLLYGALQSPPAQRLRQEWAQRSPQEIIRYALRRLEGHPRLEWLAHPALFAAQRHFEREPPAHLPTLGKGQQPHPLPALGVIVHERRADTPQAIREALQNATAGTRITVAPGLYPFAQTLRLGRAGETASPVVLTAEVPGSVVFEFGQVEGILVDQPHWVFENLRIRGVCARHDDCEHAFHVVGAARHTVIRNNHISDFNAHVKVNGFGGQWPDHGLLQFNTLDNQTPRNTTRSVALFDLVGAHGWRVQDNRIQDFSKRDGNKVAYGVFMKGASEDGRIERNLIICSPQHMSAPGVRVGISLGGGATGAAFCRQNGCQAFEHRNGLVANNVVAHCNDAGIDINHSTGIQLIHNTLVNTAGVASRGAPANATLYANLLDGRLLARDGTQIDAPASTDSTRTWIAAADELNIEPPKDTPRVQRHPLVTKDFFQRPRHSTTAPGAAEAIPHGKAP